MHIRELIASLTLLSLFGCSSALDPTPTTLSPAPSSPTIDEEVARLFTYPLPEGQVPWGFEFSPDSLRLAYFRLTGEGTLVNQRLELLDLEAGTEGPLDYSRCPSPSAFEWLPESQGLLLHAAGNLYLAPLDGQARQLTTSAVQAPQLSPDGRRVGFVRDHDLYLLEIESGRERRLTTDGSETRLNGEVDWVYDEELELTQAFWFSPQGDQLALLQFDESAVTAYPVRYPGSPAPTVVRQRYPQAGEANPTVRLGVIDLTADEPDAIRWLDLGLEGERYIARVTWTPDGDRLAVLTLDRLQRQLDLRRLDPAGEAPAEPLIAERDEQWLNLLDAPRFFSDGRRMLWRSERDGHAHLYLYDLESPDAEPRQLTHGPWEVSEVVDLDEEASVVRFLANREGPATYQLYEVPLDGSEPARRLSSERGYHDVVFAPDHGRYVDTHSSLDRPPRAELWTTDGQQLATLAEEDLHQLSDLDQVEVELFEVPGPEEITYQARLFRPAEPEPGRRYPALVWVYNGPGAQIVRDQWRTKYVPWMRLLARRGVYVFSMDGRGTSGRGRDWEKAIYGHLTEVELADQLRGVEYLQGRDDVDGDRLGVFGWSYGGTMVLAALLRHPGTFRAGVSVAPVTDWRYYDTIYTERYMMTPEQNPDGYQRTALWPLAEQLVDPLLLIHGLSDDNVHFRNSERMIEALVEEGRRFEVMVYPGQAHGISRPAPRRHVFATLTAFLLEQLGLEPRGASPAAAAE